ncbi:hypothetical protein SDC9_202249 [bioreactor metagenome]|uniref:Uncharacterized protein n=1 Tax=bioreactor metagenome TaxID=1076179 RepID=A0A645IT66_9ZZZZ
MRIHHGFADLWVGDGYDHRADCSAIEQLEREVKLELVQCGDALARHDRRSVQRNQPVFSRDQRVVAAGDIGVPGIDGENIDPHPSGIRLVIEYHARVLERAVNPLQIDGKIVVLIDQLCTLGRVSQRTRVRNGNHEALLFEKCV